MTYKKLRRLIKEELSRAYFSSGINNSMLWHDSRLDKLPKMRNIDYSAFKDEDEDSLAVDGLVDVAEEEIEKDRFGGNVNYESNYKIERIMNMLEKLNIFLQDVKFLNEIDETHRKDILVNWGMLTNRLMRADIVTSDILTKLSRNSSMKSILYRYASMDEII